MTYCVFSPSTVQVCFPVHPADTVKAGVIVILMYGCNYNELGLAQDEISFPSGRWQGLLADRRGLPKQQPGLGNGEVFPDELRVLSFLP